MFFLAHLEPKWPTEYMFTSSVLPNSQRETLKLPNSQRETLTAFLTLRERLSNDLEVIHQLTHQFSWDLHALDIVPLPKNGHPNNVLVQAFEHVCMFKSMKHLGIPRVQGAASFDHRRPFDSMAKPRQFWWTKGLTHPHLVLAH